MLQLHIIDNMRAFRIDADTVEFQGTALIPWGHHCAVWKFCYHLPSGLGDVVVGVKNDNGMEWIVNLRDGRLLPPDIVHPHDFTVCYFVVDVHLLRIWLTYLTTFPQSPWNQERHLYSCWKDKIWLWDATTALFCDICSKASFEKGMSASLLAAQKEPM